LWNLEKWCRRHRRQPERKEVCFTIGHKLNISVTGAHNFCPRVWMVLGITYLYLIQLRFNCFSHKGFRRVNLCEPVTDVIDVPSPVSLKQ
jgi:hypothetical protein